MRGAKKPPGKVYLPAVFRLTPACGSFVAATAARSLFRSVLDCLGSLGVSVLVDLLSVREDVACVLLDRCRGLHDAFLSAENRSRGVRVNLLRASLKRESSVRPCRRADRPQKTYFTPRSHCVFLLIRYYIKISGFSLRIWDYSYSTTKSTARQERSEILHPVKDKRKNSFQRINNNRRFFFHTLLKFPTRCDIISLQQTGADTRTGKESQK